MSSDARTSSSKSRRPSGMMSTSMPCRIVMRRQVLAQPRDVVTLARQRVERHRSRRGRARRVVGDGDVFVAERGGGAAPSPTGCRGRRCRWCACADRRGCPSRVDQPRQRPRCGGFDFAGRRAAAPARSTPGRPASRPLLRARRPRRAVLRADRRDVRGRAGRQVQRRSVLVARHDADVDFGLLIAEQHPPAGLVDGALDHRECRKSAAAWPADPARCRR